MNRRVILASLLLFWALSVEAQPVRESDFVGSDKCASCHLEQTQRWRGSHHDFAMNEAEPQTVLADFNGTKFTYNGITSVFRKRGDKYFVSTDGPDGKVREFQVSYVFGFHPLQQYLVKLPRGHYQVLGIAWDTRAKSAGGQRWFHLYPDEGVAFGDPLHWTSRGQNWNSQCAYCHSTNLRKNYDASKDSYATQWAEINVACESCHGPGAEHLRWASLDKNTRPGPKISPGLRAANRAKWSFGSGDAIAHPTGGKGFQSAELNTCAPCHSRRSQFAEPSSTEPPDSRSLLDAFRPSLLEEQLYFADGQMQDEVFVWGSFQQSKMFEQGVSCSDCHDPHSLKLRAEGNKLCSTCHRADVYDAKQHHFHETGSEGAECVSCHMPERTYMQIDSRRDHSFRIPRPDLSIGSALPNTCNSCHTDKSAKWAADEVVKRFEKKHQVPHYGEVFALARSGDSAAVPRLKGMIDSADFSPIVRATASMYLGRFGPATASSSLASALESPHPLIRYGAVRSIEGLGPQAALEQSVKLLDDDTRAVRMEAAAALTSLLRGRVPPKLAPKLERVQHEYEDSQHFNADRAFAHVNLAAYFGAKGSPDKIERELSRAIKIEPYFVPAYINLADYYRSRRMDVRGEEVLRSGLLKIPESPDLSHSLGLLLVRTARLEEAASELGKAATAAPDNVRYQYVYAIALRQLGKSAEGLRVLESALAKAPSNTEILYALATIYRDTGDVETALGYARKLDQLTGGSPQVQALIEQLSRPERNE